MRGHKLLFLAFLFNASLSSGIVQAHAGDHRSLSELDRLITQNPLQASLLVARGALYSRTGLWEKAERDLTLAETLVGKEDVAFEFGQLYYRSGQYDRALGYIDAYIHAYPAYVPAFLLQARAASEAKQLDLAIESYRAYFRLSATPQPGEYIVAAKLFAASTSEGSKKALELLDFGMEKVGLNAQLQRLAVKLEVDLGNTGGALTRWYSLIDQLGHSAEWNTTLAKLMILDNKLEEARQVILKTKMLLASSKQSPAKISASKAIVDLELKMAHPNN